MDFVVVDVETSNKNRGSICQIGLADFCEGQLVDRWETLVDPQEYFLREFIDEYHGIDEEMVLGAPLFPEIYNDLVSRIQGKIVLSHTDFDKYALYLATQKYDLPAIDYIWVDSARIVRQAWADLRYGGYNLKNISDRLGINFRHHDAAEDAIAAGKVVVAACQLLGRPVSQLIEEKEQAISEKRLQKFNRWATNHGRRFPPSVACQPNTDGHLYGNTLVFTGDLSIDRKKAATLAAEAGCEVADQVTKKTTILVVGKPNLELIVDKVNQKSAKEKKVAKYNRQGQGILVADEDCFFELLKESR
ncbi:MAG: hypothetical protein MPJ24_03090 [Pirellulaceae bacterium]|nr:hypothetical protein [Pirellulaceae bacterium]